MVDAFADASFGDDTESKRSSNGWVVQVSKDGRRWTVSYKARLQRATSASTAEAEMVAIQEAVNEGESTRDMLREIMGLSDVGLRVHSDSSAAIDAIRRGYSSKMSHLPRRHGVSISWLNEWVKVGRGELVKIEGQRNPADIFTKSVDRATLDRHKSALGITSQSNAAGDWALRPRGSPMYSALI
eukprot:Lankesteria_metandrocarpae@DN6144_c0_g1_i1.p2